MIAIALGVLLALLSLYSIPVLLLAAVLLLVVILNSVGPLLIFLLCLAVAAAMVVAFLLGIEAIIRKVRPKSLEPPPAWTPQFRELKAQDPNGRTAELRRKLRLPPDSSKAEPRNVPWPPDGNL